MEVVIRCTELNYDNNCLRVSCGGWNNIYVSLMFYQNWDLIIIMYQSGTGLRELNRPRGAPLARLTDVFVCSAGVVCNDRAPPPSFSGFCTFPLFTCGLTLLTENTGPQRFLDGRLAHITAGQTLLSGSVVKVTYLICQKCSKKKKSIQKINLKKEHRIKLLIAASKFCSSLLWSRWKDGAFQTVEWNYKPY